MEEIKGTWVPSLGWEDPLGEEMATHSNILVWKTPWTKEPGGLQSMQLRGVGHDWSHMHALMEALKNCRYLALLPWLESDSSNSVALVGEEWTKKGFVLRSLQVALNPCPNDHIQKTTGKTLHCGPEDCGQVVIHLWVPCDGSMACQLPPLSRRI